MEDYRYIVRLLGDQRIGVEGYLCSWVRVSAILEVDRSLEVSLRDVSVVEEAIGCS